MSDLWLNHISSALSDSGVVAYMWNANEDRFQWAGNLHALLGIREEDYPLSNAQFHKMLNPQNVPGRLTALHDVMGKLNGNHEATPAFAAEYKIRGANGTYIDINETATLHFDAQSGTKTLCGFLKVKNPEQLKAPIDGEMQSENVSFTQEGMTHYGRLSLQRKIQEWVETCDSEAGSLYGYVLVVGIDRLSLFNEAFGAGYADEVINQTGERLTQVVSNSGTVSRIDGDVFGIFFHEAPYNEMAAVAKYILKNFQDQPLYTTMGPVAIGVSIGGISIDRHARSDTGSFITKAEMAMRTAKDQGRNRFVSYKEASYQVNDTKTLLQSGDDFLRALRDNRVKLAFQPIIDSRKENVSFHECLIRYVDEKGKLHSAGQFIPAIEKLGFGQIVDQFALKMAIHELTMFPDLSLSVNVSNLSLTQQDWLRGLVSALRDRPSVAKRLIIEITESAVIEDMEKTLRVVRTLQDLGCRVALDDFGAGYTAFSQLRQLKVDIVKIDKSFVRNMNEEHNHLFVRTLQALADGINVETVGEGAETAADAKQLASDGVNHIQGYVFGFPQVERVWLPKDHVYRRISASDMEEDNFGQTIEQKAIIDDLSQLAKNRGNG